MLSHESIQSKIDSMIKEANSKDVGTLRDDYNDVKILLYYNHCIDIFEFLKLYSKVQLNELLVKIAIIYDLLGNSQLSLEILNESLKIIPNTPRVILFKSGLFATMNKLEEAQKYLTKYKYLIGEDPYNTYIYNSIKIIYYYLLEYEENIILREIELLEKEFPEYYNGNVILNFLKSKMLHKLSEKFKNIDKTRSYLYEKESIQNEEKALNIRRLDAEYLFKNDINKEKFINIISMIYPNFINYKPNPLVKYNSNFKSGFGLFFTLFEITKIIKLKMLINKQKKLNKDNKAKNNLLNKNNNKKNIINSNTSLEISSNETIYNSDNEANKYQESISFLSKSVWLQRYTYGSNNIYIIDNKQIKEKKAMKNIDINDINYKLKANYYIYKGYYSMLNLKDVIIKNINFNNKLKEMKDSFSNELNEDFEQSKKFKETDYKILMEENIIKKDNDIISKAKSNKNELKKHNILQTRLIESTKNKHKIGLNVNNNSSKDKSLRMNTEPCNNNQRNLEKEKRNNLQIITDKIQIDDNRKINSVKKDLIYIGSNKNVIKSSDNTLNGNNKKTKKYSIKDFNKKENNNSNIFTNIIPGNKRLYTIRNNKYDSKDKNKKKTIDGKRSKEKESTSVKTLEKYQEIYTEIRHNKVKNRINSKKNVIYINNSHKNNTKKDLYKYFKKKDDHSNNKNSKINEEVKGKNDKKYLSKNKKELYNKILEGRVKERNLKRYNTRPLQKKINEKNLTIDSSPFNTINSKESSNNTRTYKNLLSYKNINKLLNKPEINNYYCKKKANIHLNNINIYRKSENKKEKKKDKYLTIVLDSKPKTLINTSTCKKASIFSSSKEDS